MKCNFIKASIKYAAGYPGCTQRCFQKFRSANTILNNLPPHVLIWKWCAHNCVLVNPQATQLSLKERAYTSGYSFVRGGFHPNNNDDLLHVLQAKHTVFVKIFISRMWIDKQQEWPASSYRNVYVEHLPYSPDPAPSISHPFRSLYNLAGKLFQVLNRWQNIYKLRMNEQEA